MKKKAFVLSWGRKIFFGLGWPLTCLVALSYFSSTIIPQTLMGWLYYIVTFIGHYGLILGLTYFLFYCPVVLLFPSYYISRIWSVVLLLAVNIFIFMDSYFFSKYRYHLDSFLGSLLKEDDSLGIIGVSSEIKIGLLVVGFIVFFTLWIRGEKTWRQMKARFSNPVKNWYLVLIILCLVTSHLMHAVGDAQGARYITRISELFPVHYPLTAKSLLHEKNWVERINENERQGYKDFYYPAGEMRCSLKGKKNVLFIVLESWRAEDLNESLTPNISHYAFHGTIFRNHFSGGPEASEGYFSLFYGLPPVYEIPALNSGTLPVFLREMQKADLDMRFYQSEGLKSSAFFIPRGKIKSFSAIERDLDQLQTQMAPFFMSIYLDTGSLQDKDMQVRHVLELFHKYDLNSDTITVITGSHGKSQNSEFINSQELRTPLLVIWPGHEKREVGEVTSHYDIVPTIMKEEWNCENDESHFAFGKSLFTTEKKKFLVVGDYAQLGVWNSEKGVMTTIGEYSGLSSKDREFNDVELEEKEKRTLLNILNETTYFFRGH